jgi:DNA-binding MarR family transcriptional regulator
MRDGSGSRLRQAAASAQQALGRIARLSGALAPAGTGVSLVEMAERLYAQRRARDQYFPAGLFGEPAWDLLLALFIALEDGRELGLGDAYRAAGIGAAAGRSLIATMEDAGLVARIPAENGRKPGAVRLTETGVERLCAYLTRII